MRARPSWALAVALLCLLFAGLLGLSCAFDVDEDLAIAPSIAAIASPALDESEYGLSQAALRCRPAGAFAALGLYSRGLLAAVPGGLRLLI